MEGFTTQLNEIKTQLLSCSIINSKSKKSDLYATLLQLQEHSVTEDLLLKSLADLVGVVLPVMASDVLHDDEEIASQALKCMGFMIYHPSIVTGISGDDADTVLSSLQKVILSTRIKSVCNLGVWCISVQQLNPLFLNTHIESLVRAIVHALDNPTGSLSTTFEAMQAVMKLETQVNEKMRETSSLWAPPIYRRLVSADKRERDMSERCLQKIKSLLCPPPEALSKVVIVDVKRKLLPAMEDLLKQGMKIQAMQAWGWYTRLIGSYAIKNRQLINQLLKIPEQTFPDSDPQVKIASQVAWEALIDALIILPPQESTKEAATHQTYEDNDNNIFETNRLSKSIKLIMTPLIGTMSTKCDSSVHLSCLNTWTYLLHKLDTHVNHPFVNKTVLEPMLEAVFRAGDKNIWSWNFCLNILDGYALAKNVDGSNHYSIKWTPWSLDRFDFFVKMVDLFVSHGEVARDAALRIFRSSLKSVQVILSGSSVPFSEVMLCISSIINFLKKISEGGVGQTVDFIEIVTEELQPSILGSPLYKMKLDIKYSENMNEMNDDGNMVSPVVYFIILYFHDLIKSTPDESKLSKVVAFLLQSYDIYDILHTFTCLLRKFLIPDCLSYWIVIANCLKDYVDGKSEVDDNWDLDDLEVSRFLAYPFVVFSSGSRKSFDFVQVVKSWKSVYTSTKCGESLFPVFDRFLEDYSKIDATENDKRYEFLTVCGDAIICVLEHILKSSDDVGGHKRLPCTKNSLQCAARYLSVSYTEAKSNPQMLDATSSVFATLTRVVESFHFEEDIVLFVEIISNALFQWLSDSELQHENTIYQLHRLWTATLKSTQTSWPPISFNSTFLKLQATLLEATLDHSNPSISNPTVTFWNATYGQQVKIDYPQNLLPVLDKLSRNGKINLRKKRYSTTDATGTGTGRVSPPNKHKVTTTLNHCVKRVNGPGGGNGSKRKRLELTEHQKEVRRAQQGKSKDCEGRGPGVRTYTSADFSQETQDESQEESQDVRNVECILDMLKKGGKTF